MLNGGANILFKLGARHGFEGASALSALVLGNWQLLLGLVLFLGNALLYFLALRTLQLSVAYPVMVVMSFIIINSFAFIVLGEPITSLQIFGYLLIIGGICLVLTRVSLGA